MDGKKVSVLDILELNLQGYDDLKLRCIGGKRGLSREIMTPDINRPGIALSGFFERFAFNRVQLFGRGEAAYIQQSVDKNVVDHLEKMFHFPIPCCVFSNNHEPPREFMNIIERACCPVLQTPLQTSDIANRLMRAFNGIFAPRQTVHGVLVEVYGVGILLTGHSGVGKSETALELVERGHRLVADDLVEVVCMNGNTIVGRGVNTLISHHMEIRGLGIINITKLYGISSVLDKKEIQLVIELEEWDGKKDYDRVGVDQAAANILGVAVPKLVVPVKPGRNLPIIIETASMNQRLRSIGVDSAKDFNQNVLRWMEMTEVQSTYFESEDLY